MNISSQWMVNLIIILFNISIKCTTNARYLYVNSDSSTSSIPSFTENISDLGSVNGDNTEDIDIDDTIIANILGIPLGYTRCSTNQCDSSFALLCDRISVLSNETYTKLSNNGECICCWRKNSPQSALNQIIVQAKEQLSKEFTPVIKGKRCRRNTCDSRNGIICSIAATNSDHIISVINPFDGNDCYCCINNNN